jgi:hypothetical protein
MHRNSVASGSVRRALMLQREKEGWRKVRAEGRRDRQNRAEAKEGRKEELTRWKLGRKD